MKKILHQSRLFSLAKHNIKNPKKRGKGHAMYIITVEGWFTSGEMEEIRNIVDPMRNLSGNGGFTWKFKNLTLAQKVYTMLLLRWGA